MNAYVVWTRLDGKRRRHIVNASKWIVSHQRSLNLVSVHLNSTAYFEVGVYGNRKGSEVEFKVDFSLADDAWRWVHQTALVGLPLEWLQHRFVVSPVGLLRPTPRRVGIREEAERRWPDKADADHRFDFRSGAIEASAEFYRRGALGVPSSAKPDWTAGYIWMGTQIRR